MYKTNFEFISEKAKALSRPVRVAVAGADAENILQGVFRAQREGWAEPVLLGDTAKIERTLKDMALFDQKYTIIQVDDNKQAVQKAIDLIKAGGADILMRGNQQTRDFLMPLLNKENGLIREGRLLTQICLFKVPEYPRLLAVSDVTILPNPSEEQRREVVRNVAETLNALGYECPNIALLSLVEIPAFHMRDTIEAQNIVRKHEEKPIANCRLVGPIPYDLIISKEAARLKNYDCDCCGEFDAIVTPNLLAGNLLVKAMQIHGHASSCGVVVGAKIPVAITSRSDSPEQAYLSLAMCAALPAVED